jgi:hypothetical protein
MLLDVYRTFQDWEDFRKKQDISRPTVDTLYGWTRPGERRDELLRDEVLSRDAGRWVFNFKRYTDHVAKRAASCHNAAA